MNERVAATAEVCSELHQSVELIGKRWTGAIVSVMLGGANHACDIRNAVPGLSDRLLTERLRELEATGIVRRDVTDARPPIVEYSLTDKGEALAPVLDAISVWGKSWK
ncbi:MAG: HTH-type transcriptional regulator YodB [Actinomycetota bacterium]